MDLGLKACKALVIGASKGLGKACAEALAGEGADVFICARKERRRKSRWLDIAQLTFRFRWERNRL
jgi:3-oxoacyl-[acyl-carrier protein] reductase